MTFTAILLIFQCHLFSLLPLHISPSSSTSSSTSPLLFRLQHGYQCLLLLKRLRIIRATVDFSLIRRAAKTIAFAKRNKSQWPITCLTGRRGTDPGTKPSRPRLGCDTSARYTTELFSNLCAFLSVCLRVCP